MNKEIFKNETLMEVEFFMEGNMCCLYISHEGSSGCKYTVNSPSEVAKAIKDYTDFYLLLPASSSKDNK